MGAHLLGLRTVIYPVPDLDAAKDWWTGFLDTGPYFDQPFYVEFDVGGYKFGLLPDADPADGAQAYWGIIDVPAAVERAVGQGCEIHSPTSDLGDGIVTAVVRRREGTLIGSIDNPNFSPG
jgi:catechol 2,3-dioxygenase-like lactoylglutathione lyase family enzyme